MKPSELLSSPEKWCCNNVAENANGELVGGNSPQATKWGALGAIYFVYGQYTQGMKSKLYTTMLKMKISPIDLHTFNRRYGYHMVVKLFKQAGM